MSKGRKFYKSSITGRYTSKNDPNAITYIKVTPSENYGKKSIKIGDSRIIERLPKPEKLKPKLSEKAQENQREYNQNKIKSQIQNSSIKSSTDLDITTTLIDSKATSQRLADAFAELKEEFNDDKKSKEITAYSYKLESKSKSERYSTGTIYNLEKQLEVMQIFEKANAKLKLYEEQYGIQLGTGFKLYENSTPFSIDRKMVAAQQVLQDDYVTRLANSYKLDAIENFINHVDRDAISDLIKVLPDADPLEFLKYIKKYNLGYISHAYDSDLDEAEYQRLDGVVRSMTKDIEKMNREKAVKNERDNKN